jgi:hypothetical protein
MIPMYTQSGKVDALANSPIVNAITWAADTADIGGRTQQLADMFTLFGGMY